MQIVSDENLAEITRRIPFYVDNPQKGVVRGGWYDELGGILVGNNAPYVADALNYYAANLESTDDG